MSDFSATTMADRAGEALRRSLPHLAPEVRGRVEELINPSSLAIIGGVLVAWVASHAFGVGEAVDLVLGIVGTFSIGFAVFTGFDELAEFTAGTYRARSESDLDEAGRHFARAVSIRGVEAVLALLFRGRPRTNRGKPLGIGPEPPRGAGRGHSRPRSAIRTFHAARALPIRGAMSPTPCAARRRTKRSSSRMRESTRS